MKKTQFFVISTLIMSAILIGALSFFDSQSSIEGWFISDVAFGTLLYLSYLAIAMNHANSQVVDSTELAIYC